MKLTDLLKKGWDTLDSVLVDDLFVVIEDEVDESFPESLDTKEEIFKLLDVVEDNFFNIEYTDNHALIEWLGDHESVVSDMEEVEDIEKEIIYRTFIFSIDNEFWKLVCHTGYYNFPLTNEMKKVNKKSKTVEYFE